MRGSLRRQVWPFYVLVAAMGAGCGAEASTEDAGTADAAAMEDASPPEDAALAFDGSACDASASPLACEDLTPDPTCAARWVVGVRGSIEEEGGTPVEAGRAQLCVRLSPSEALACLSPPISDAEGRFTIVAPTFARCMSSAAMRVLAPGQPFATTYCHVELGASGAVVDLDAPFVLHRVSAAIAPARGEGASEREIGLPGGLFLTLAPDALPEPSNYAELAGARVASGLPCGVGGDAIAVWALAPEVSVSGGAALRIEDGLGLAPGTEVELLVLGGLETRLEDGTLVPEAELAVFGTGMVSIDGARIETSARLPYLSWLAVRER